MAETPQTSQPVLLLPLRLETRFKDGKLLVRIFPDDVFIDTHEPDLTEAEYEAAKQYLNDLGVDARAAWRTLALRFGSTRAAWIARWAHEWSAVHDIETLPPLKPAAWMHAPTLRCMPDFLTVFAYRDDGTFVSQACLPLQADLTVLASPENWSANGVLDTHSEWIRDFEAAKAVGLAIEIGLNSEDQLQGFSKLCVVGIRSGTPLQGRHELVDLLHSHHYTEGLGFVASGSPTNNTATAKSPYTERDDPERSFHTEIQGPPDWWGAHGVSRRTNGHRLADALGIDAGVFRYTEQSGDIGDFFAGDMNAVVWTATGDSFFRDLLPKTLDEDQLAAVAEHVRLFVRGGGPLPTLRVGQQPYGVLPVTRVPSAEHSDGGWSPDSADGYDNIDSTVVDRGIHELAMKFFGRWLEVARDPNLVPRVNTTDTPDQEMLSILSMEPRAVTYRARPFVTEVFVAWLITVLRHYAFDDDTPYAYADTGETPLQWMKHWSDSWQEFRAGVVDLLSDLAGGPLQSLTKPPLLNLLGWWEGDDEPRNMVYDPEKPNFEPFVYLRDIIRSRAADIPTLLAQIARRALKLAASRGERAQVAEALERLSGSTIIDYFNAVSEPEQLVARIEDDPDFGGRSPRAYGVRHGVALATLERREALGGKFTSLQQIDEVRGIGRDTLHDIIYSFRNAAWPDIDRLFRDSLDLSSHRVDAWVTSFAFKRLQGMRRRRRSGIHLGAYGFVEDLRPRREASSGYVHTPSAGQAAAAAVLHNAFLTHSAESTETGVNPFRANLTSGRVRHALRIVEGIRQSQSLDALLGYRFERALQDHERSLEQYIDDFREAFPIVAGKLGPPSNGESVETIAARNVVAGADLLRDYRQEDNTAGKVVAILDAARSESDRDANALEEVLQTIDDTLDAVSDLLLTEGVYQACQGNYERSGAAIDAASGNAMPPDRLDSVTTPVAGREVTHRVCLLFNGEQSADEADPRGTAEPRIAHWFGRLLGVSSRIGCGFEIQEADDPDNFVRRVNVNTATVAQLTRVPGIDQATAESIVQARRERLFDSVADLERVGLSESLRPFLTAGLIERVDINHAPVDALAALPRTPTVGSDDDSWAWLESYEPLGEELAARIVAARNFDWISDLERVEGLTPSIVQALRPFVTTGRTTLSFGDLAAHPLSPDGLGMSASDFLYVAQTPPEGAQSELEQRIGFLLRRELALPATTRVRILPGSLEGFDRCLEDAVELARQALKVLTAGRPLSPDLLNHPGDVAEAGFSSDDAQALAQRVEVAKGYLDAVLADLRTLAPGEQLLTPQEREAIAAALLRAARFGVYGAVPPGADEQDLSQRLANTIKELDGRSKACAELLDVPPDSPTAVPQLLRAMRSLFGASFVVAPLFAPYDGALPAHEIVEGTALAGFVVRGIVLHEAPEGAYTFRQDDPRAGEVRLLRYGVEVLQLGYDYHTTISFDDPYRFSFPGYFDIDIGKEGSGTRNLYGLSESFFAGNQVLLVQDDGTNLERAFHQSNLIPGDHAARLRLWLQQMAEVRPAIADLEDLLMLAEGWTQAELHGNSPSLALRVAQLPYSPERAWLGLSMAEGAEPKPPAGQARSPLSVVAALAGDLPSLTSDPTGASPRVLAGLILDEVSELIPNAVVDTSVAFHYDAPSTQAPQAFLLAVPSALSDPAEPWTHEMLAEIVNDTIDLTKVRAVDIDALRSSEDAVASGEADVGAFLPASYVAADPKKTGWASDSLVDTVDKFIQALTSAREFCADLAGFIDGNGLGPTFDDLDLGMHLESIYLEPPLAAGPPLAHGAGNSIIFAETGIRLTWAPGGRGELIITISRIGDPFYEEIPSVHAYNASGDIILSGWTGEDPVLEFRLDLDMAVRVEIAGGYVPGVGHEYGIDSICVRNPLPPTGFVEGTEIESFVIKKIVLRSAPAGDYTFFQEDPLVGKFRLLRNGTTVRRELEYDCHAIISYEDPYCLRCDDYFDIYIGKRGSGTQNLYGLKYSVFDGNHVLRIQNQAGER